MFGRVARTIIVNGLWSSASALAADKAARVAALIGTSSPTFEKDAKEPIPVEPPVIPRKK